VPPRTIQASRITTASPLRDAASADVAAGVSGAEVTGLEADLWSSIGKRYVPRRL
jgi:hypothetical protein